MSDNIEKSDTFNQLVTQITDSERSDLLEKMKLGLNSLSSDTISDAFEYNDKVISIEEKLNEESIFTKFFLWLKSLFGGCTIKEAYNEFLIDHLYHKLNRNYPGLLDYKNGYLTNGFYNYIYELKEVADFFSPYVNAMEADEGSFYVFLGSFVVPEITNEMNTDANPLNIPMTKDVSGALRTSMINKMNEILKSILPEKKSYMYSCVLGLEWLWQFVNLPFQKILNSFIVLGDTHVCKYESILTELSTFSRLMCNPKIVTDEMIQALYVFTAGTISNKENSEGEMISMPTGENKEQQFINKAKSNISIIMSFIKNVPFRLINQIVYSNVEWQPSPFGGAEDWFVKYKKQWKKLFDDKWEAWVKEKKKNELKVRLKSLFSIEEFPMLPIRPWKKVGDGIPFHFEYAAGFLYWFMHERYAIVSLPLKILSFEGVFVNKDNRAEFANTLNDLAQIQDDFEKTVANLASNGQYGGLFEKYALNNLRNHATQTKLNSIMLSIESVVQDIKTRFCNDCRIAFSVVLGVIGDKKKDTRYDGIQNAITIQGANNAKFKKDLLDSATTFSNCLDFIRDLETLDLPGSL